MFYVGLCMCTKCCALGAYVVGADPLSDIAVLQVRGEESVAPACDATPNPSGAKTKQDRFQAQVSSTNLILHPIRGLGVNKWLRLGSHSR